MPDALFNSVTARALLVVLTCNASCALVGCFLVLRRMSMMGDALSHAVLPGLVIAFLLSGSMGAAPMLAGAIGAGVVTTFLTQAVHRYGRVTPDASLGVVYTSLFALGVLLIKQRLSDTHFDIQCVYEGSLLVAALDTQSVAGVEVPRAMFAAAPVLVLVVAALAVFWKELKIAAFDPPLAATLGFAPGAMHYLLMLLVSLATVTSFEAIGSILVVAMLIAPGAAAQLFARRLAPMLALSVALSVVATAVGCTVSMHPAVNVSPSGAIAVTAGLIYIGAVLFAPGEGVVSRALDNARVALRVRREDVLTLLYRRDEAGAAPALPAQEAVAVAGGGPFGRLAVRSLKRRGEATRDAAGLRLTDAGAALAAQLVRGHRLWEAYLVDEMGVAPDHVHEAAHVMEHVLDERIRGEIAEKLGVETDPHGRDIPG